MGTLSTSPSASRASVKKETKVVVTAVKDVKSDSSFFSAPKPKPKLPSFKKAPPLVVKQEANIAQPNAFDPFQEALKSMAKNRTASPVVSTPPPTSAGSSAPASINITKSAKKKKSVTWASESQLEQIRLIDKAVYDDDPVDVSIPRVYCLVVLYINYALCAPVCRELMKHTTYVTWSAARGRRYTPTCSRKP